MDAKTMLLLGIGMAVLLLLGFCVAPSRSAALPDGHQLPLRSSATPGGTQAWSSGRERHSPDQLFKTSGRRIFQVVEHPAMLVGLEG
jgi:hypothetical protein